MQSPDAHIGHADVTGLRHGPRAVAIGIVRRGRDDDRRSTRRIQTGMMISAAIAMPLPLLGRCFASR